MKRRPTIRIFLPDGEPEGIKIVSKTNWVGSAVYAPRTALERAKQSRSELSGPGVYVLIGEEEGKRKVYIGEADVLKDRLSQHDTNKNNDFWTHFISFSSNDDILNKAIISYIEAKLISLAKDAKAWNVLNKQSPKLPNLSEIDVGAAEEFLEEMLVIYPILGVTAFETVSDEVSDPHEDIFILDQCGAKGRGVYKDKGFVVLKGSRARKKEVSSANDAIRHKRKELIENGVLVEDGDYLVFSQDFIFSSPSAASSVLVGGASNGRSAWKRESDNKSIKDIFD